MHRSGYSLVLFLFIVFPFGSSNGARILGLFPHPGKSHFDVFQVLMEGLANRGHEVTVVSFFPHKEPPPRYHDISLVGLQPVLLGVLNFNQFEQSIPDWVLPYHEMLFLAEIGLKTCEALLPSDQIQNLLKENGNFDLIVMEQFNTDCFLAVVHKLQVPFVAISSCSALHWSITRFGNPTDPSYFPNVLLGRTDRMNVLERVENMVLNFITSALYNSIYNRPAEELVKRYIGDTPPLQEIAKNTSLLMINTHFTLHQPKPFLPGIIEIGGIHVRPAKPLPQEIEDYIAGAEHGVIVLSLGSMLNADTLPAEKINTFLNVFRKIKQSVVWKISGNLTNLPTNVRTMAWLPQRDIVAHANVRAFIAHGGLLGLTEAIYGGKPIVAIPMFGDQATNVQAAVQAGVAIELPYSQITEQTLRFALDTILQDRYQKRALEVSILFQDRPIKPLDLAVYWIEYIIRHGGSPLRSAAAGLSYYQYYLLDALAILVLVAVVTFYVFKKCLAIVFKLFRKKQKVL